MSFPYTIGLPNPPDDPSADVGGMQENTNTIDSWVSIDHVGFRNSNGGKHNQVTFVNSQSTPSFASVTTQIYPQSFGSGVNYLETFAKIATSGSTQINAYLPLIKAMAQFTIVSSGGSGTCGLITTNSLAINVASVTQAGNNFTITFTQALPYATYQVFANTLQRSVSGGYVFTVTSRNTNTFVLNLSNSNTTMGDIIGFMVI